MNYNIGCDAHKHYSQIAVFDDRGQLCIEGRVNHEPGALRAFFEPYPPGTFGALETIGNWYWVVDEIEAAGCRPLMAHAAKAKVMMGLVNKTDKLDAKGLATLLRTQWHLTHRLDCPRSGAGRTRVTAHTHGLEQDEDGPQESPSCYPGQIQSPSIHRQ
jgi:hypothetical protein